MREKTKCRLAACKWGGYTSVATDEHTDEHTSESHRNVTNNLGKIELLTCSAHLKRDLYVYVYWL